MRIPIIRHPGIVDVLFLIDFSTPPSCFLAKARTRASLEMTVGDFVPLCLGHAIGRNYEE
jgi:hypothetical protein